jgi:hypothetical protein
MKKSKLLWILIAVIALFNIVFYLPNFSGGFLLNFVSDFLPVICSFIASVCLFIAFKGFKEFDFSKKAWILIFIGIGLDFIAETLYGVMDVFLKINMNEAYPSIADYAWCAAYIPLFIGLAMMFFGYRRSGFPMGNMLLYGLFSILIIIICSVVIYFLLVPILHDAESSPLEKFIYMFYPIADLFLVIPAMILMYVTSLFGKGIISKPWKYLAIGFIFFTIADLIYSYLDWLGEYKSGNYIDLAWNLGYLLIGMAGIYQRELIESMKGGHEQ